MLLENSKVITSSTNSYLKLVRSLEMKKYRLKHGLYIAEGVRTCIEVFRHGKVKYCFLNSESLENIEKSDELKRYLTDFPPDQILLLNDHLFNRLSSSATPQGIICAVELPDYIHEEWRDDLIEPDTDLILFIEGVSDPGNLGTIFRLGLGMGIDNFILSGDCADPFGPKVVRSSTGLLSRAKLFQFKDSIKILQGMKGSGFKIIASVCRGGRSLNDFTFPFRSVLVLGAEAEGLSEHILNLADEKVHIPIETDIDSFNVATSAAIFLYAYNLERSKRNE